MDPAFNFLAFASVMGLLARRVERAADIAGVVETGSALGLPNLIEIPIRKTQP